MSAPNSPHVMPVVPHFSNASSGTSGCSSGSLTMVLLPSSSAAAKLSSSIPSGTAPVGMSNLQWMSFLPAFNIYGNDSGLPIPNLFYPNCTYGSSMMKSAPGLPLSQPVPANTEAFSTLPPSAIPMNLPHPSALKPGMGSYLGPTVPVAAPHSQPQMRSSIAVPIPKRVVPKMSTHATNIVRNVQISSQVFQPSNVAAVDRAGTGPEAEAESESDGDAETDTDTDTATGAGGSAPPIQHMQNPPSFRVVPPNAATALASGGVIKKQKLKRGGRASVKDAEDMFKCQICSRMLCRKDSLDRHMKRHLGEHKFNCSACRKPFLERSSLVRHYRQGHKDLSFDQLLAQTVFPKVERGRNATKRV